MALLRFRGTGGGPVTAGVDDPIPFTGEITSSPGDPSSGNFAVAPSDAANFATPARSLYVGGAGDVVVVAPDGSVTKFVAVPAGTVLPVRATRVNLTGTTATSIVGMI